MSKENQKTLKKGEAIPETKSNDRIVEAEIIEKVVKAEEASTKRNEEAFETLMKDVMGYSVFVKKSKEKEIIGKIAYRHEMITMINCSIKSLRQIKRTTRDVPNELSVSLINDQIADLRSQAEDFGLLLLTANQEYLNFLNTEEAPKGKPMPNE